MEKELYKVSITVYQSALKQAYITFALSSILCIITITLFAFMYKRLSKEDFNSESACANSIIACVSLVAAFLMLVMTCYNAGVLINPDYYALQKLSELIIK